MSFREVFQISQGRELEEYYRILIMYSKLFERGDNFIPLDLNRFNDINEALPDLVVETRIQGGLPIPGEWWPENNVQIPSTKLLPELPRWSITIHYKFCTYDGQNNETFSELLNYTNFLIANEEIVDKVANYIFMAIDWCILKGDIGGAIDGLTLLNQLPIDNKYITIVLDDIITIDNIGLKMGIAKLLERHRCNKDIYINELKKLAINAPCTAISQSPIRALRIVGGEKGFSALLEVISNSKIEGTTKLANRALAWVMDFDGIEEQIKKLVFSKDKARTKIGSVALNERRNHNILSYGGPLATDAEKEEKRSV